MKSIIILSGGMDSTTALYWARASGKDIVACVNFQYGSKHNQKEAKAFDDIIKTVNIKGITINLPFVNEFFQSDLLHSGGEIPEGHYADLSMKKTVVPFRNGIMLSISAGLAESLGASEIVLGNHFGDHAIYPDCRADFADSMAKTIKLGTYAQINLTTPFIDKTKTDIAKIGSDLKVPFELTWSCYNGREKHCGKCGTCVERLEAFNHSGIKDPVEYE